MKVLLVTMHWVGGVSRQLKEVLVTLDHEVEIFYYNKPLQVENPQSNLITNQRVKNIASGLVPRNLINLRRLYLEQKAARSETRRIEKINRELVDKTDEYHPDLILIVKGETLYPETLAEIREKCKTKIAWLWFDSYWTYVLNYPRLLHLFEQVDFASTVIPAEVEQLKQLGISNIYYLPGGFHPLIDPKVADKHELSDYLCEVSFLGNGYYERTFLLRRLADFDLQIRGVGWTARFSERDKEILLPAFKEGFVDPFKEYLLYKGSKVNLNLMEVFMRGAVSERMFRIAGYGGFQIINHSAEVKRFLQPGREIETFRTVQELREKIRYFVNHPKEREEMAKRAQKIVLQKHTLLQRIEEMLDIMKLK